MARKSNPMQSTWTKASKVRRAFKAGKPREKDLIFDVETAVLTCRWLFIEIRKERSVAGIKKWAEDVQVALVLVTPESSKADRAYILPIPQGLEGLPALNEEAEKLERTHRVIPLGAAFWQRDRDAADEVDTWVQLWLTGPRAARASDAARKAFKESDGKETRVSRVDF